MTREIFLMVFIMAGSSFFEGIFFGNMANEQSWIFFLNYKNLNGAFLRIDTFAVVLYLLTPSVLWRAGCRDIPLSDGQKLWRYLFLSGLLWCGFAVGFAAIVSIILQIIFLILGDMPIEVYSMLFSSPEMILKYIAHYGYAILIMVGIFIIGGAVIMIKGVVRNRWVKMALLILSCVLMRGVTYFLVAAASGGGFSGKSYTLRDLADLRLALPLPYLWLLGVWIFAAAFVWLSYRLCLRLYRHGYKSQRSFSLGKERKRLTKSQSQLESIINKKPEKPPFAYRKNGRIKAAGVSLLIVAVSALLISTPLFLINIFVFGDDSKVQDMDVKMNGAASYGQWEETISGIDSRALDAGRELSVFPESVDSKNVEHYNARLKGIVSKEGSYKGVELYRFLTQRLSEEDYVAEKMRLAAISCTDREKGETRRILRAEATDESGNDMEVYIAVISGREEYALCYDGENRIIYVFSDESGAYRYEGEGSAYLPKAEWELVPLEARNTDDGGFSIYQ